MHKKIARFCCAKPDYLPCARKHGLSLRLRDWKGSGILKKMTENKRLRLFGGESRSPGKPGGNLLPEAPEFHLRKTALNIF